MSDTVRHNTDTNRVVTVCECEPERTVSLPDYAISYHDCECGRRWFCDGQTLQMFEPGSWRRGRGQPTR